MINKCLYIVHIYRLIYCVRLVRYKSFQKQNVSMMKDRNNTNTGILCHNLLEKKKCSSLEVCRFLNSCRHENSTSPCEGNFETVINVVCIVKNQVQLLQCYCCRVRWNITEILVGCKIFCSLWVTVILNVLTAVSVSAVYCWRGMSDTLLLVKIMVCAESKTCFYIRGKRRNCNTHLQVSSICWSQISPPKTEKPWITKGDYISQ